MGVEYRLFKNLPKREAFNLDKGGWGNIFRSDRHFRIVEAALDVSSLAIRISEKVYPGNPNYGWDECRWLAEHILRWAGDSPVWLENDTSGDSAMWVRYRVTADRFHDQYVESEEEWRKNLEAHEARQDEVEKMKANALEQAFGPNWRMNQTDAPEPKGHIVYDQMSLVSTPKLIWMRRQKDGLM